MGLYLNVIQSVYVEQAITTNELYNIVIVIPFLLITYVIPLYVTLCVPVFYIFLQLEDILFCTLIHKCNQRLIFLLN